MATNELQYDYDRTLGFLPRFVKKKPGNVPVWRAGHTASMRCSRSSDPSTSDKFLILGLGDVGYYLAKRLVLEGYLVTVVEANNELIWQVDGEIDAIVLLGTMVAFSRIDFYHSSCG